MGINNGLMMRPGGPTDEGEMKREIADKIMSQGYGENWFGVLVASEKTNSIQAAAMAAAYESAIGYQKPGSRR